MMFPLIPLPIIEAIIFYNYDLGQVVTRVSINSTSNNRSDGSPKVSKVLVQLGVFPLIPLPIIEAMLGTAVPRIKMSEVSINSTSNNRSDSISGERILYTIYCFH